MPIVRRDTNRGMDSHGPNLRLSEHTPSSLPPPATALKSNNYANEHLAFHGSSHCVSTVTSQGRRPHCSATRRCGSRGSGRREVWWLRSDPRHFIVKPHISPLHYVRCLRFRWCLHVTEDTIISRHVWYKKIVFVFFKNVFLS